MTPITAPWYQPPSEEEFMGHDFQPSDVLTDIVYELIAKHEALNFLSQFKLGVLWKGKGGTSKGKQTLGKCVKPSGLTAFFSGLDWVIWVAADHVRRRKLDDRQLEALLFHELNHCRLDEDGLAIIVGHDLEIFLGEVEEYGLWEEDLKEAAPIFRQLDLGGQFTNGDGG